MIVELVVGALASGIVFTAGVVFGSMRRDAAGAGEEEIEVVEEEEDEVGWFDLDGFCLWEDPVSGGLESVEVWVGAIPGTDALEAAIGLVGPKSEVGTFLAGFVERFEQ